MHMYYVFGLRHEAFVKANSPEEALMLAKDVVQEWEYVGVKEAIWIDGILTPKNEFLLEAKEE